MRFLAHERSVARGFQPLCGDNLLTGGRALGLEFGETQVVLESLDPWIRAQRLMT